MTERIIALACFAAFSTATSGQTRWIIDHQIQATPVEARIGFVVKAGFPSTDFAFAATFLDFVASEPGWEWGQSFFLPQPYVPPRPIGNILVGIVTGQVHYPPMVIADPSNPIPVFEAHWKTSDLRPRIVEFETRTIRFDVYPDAAAPASESRVASLMEGRTSIVVPSPSVMAVVGCGAVLALRRRR